MDLFYYSECFKWILISVDENKKLYKLFFRIQNVVVVLIWLLIIIVSLYLFPSTKKYFWFLGIAGIISSLYLVKYEPKNLTRLLVPSVIVSICLIFLMNTQIFPYIFSFQAPPKAARFFTANALTGDKLYNYNYGQYELFFYSEPQAIQLDNFDEMKSVAGKKGTWIFTDEIGFKEIQDLNLNPVSIITYNHLYLDRGGKFILPSSREKALHPMYLIRY